MTKKRFTPQEANQASPNAMDAISKTVDKKFISLEALSDRIGLGRSAIYKLINKGEFTPIKFGRRTLFSEPQVLTWMEIQEARAQGESRREKRQKSGNGSYRASAEGA